jgi:hypothetical protein
MAFDPVPWFVDGGDPTVDTLRTLAYAAGAGREGIINPTDFNTTALEFPGAGVVVAPGSGVVEVRTQGYGDQAYIVRAATPTQVDCTPNGPAGARSDLVVIRVEDPQVDANWPIPEDPLTGPYTFLRMVEDVPPGTTRLQDVRPTDSGFAVARIDWLPNASSVTQAMITDLRPISQPRTERLTVYLGGVWSTVDNVGEITDEWETFPLGAVWPVPVPTWATHAQVDAEWVQLTKADTVLASGNVRVSLGDQSGVGLPYRANTAQRHSLVAGATLLLDPAVRGTVQLLSMEGIGDVGNAGTLSADVGTTVKAAVHFYQAPVAE